MRQLACRILFIVFAINCAQVACAVEDDAALIKRQSDEFSDASATGDAKVFEKYLDDDVIFMNEGGDIATKHDIVSGATPSAAGMSNKLVQTDFDIKLHGNVAVTSFTDNSTVDVYGQISHARYRSTEVWLKKNGAWKMISSQTLALQDDPPAVLLPQKTLDEYAGSYSAGQKLSVKISRQDDGLISATNGASTKPLLAEVRDVLFTPGQPRVRRIFTRDERGRITGFIARHEGHDLVFKREA